MKRLIELIEQHQALLSVEEKQQMLEGFAVMLFGSRQNARKRLKKIKTDNPEADSFEKALLREFAVEPLLALGEFFRKVDTLEQLITKTFEADKYAEKIHLNLADEKRLKILTANLKKSRQNFAVGLYEQAINGKKCFSLKEIRDEIPVNKRTFTKWLQADFGRKYEDRKFVTLLEYSEIQKMLLTKVEEKGFKPQLYLGEYQERLKHRKMFKKDIIDKACSSYKEAAKICSKLPCSYDESDVYPFRTAMELIEKQQ